MGLLPHGNPFLFGQVPTLVTAGMTGVAHGRDSKIVTFGATAFVIPELIGVSGYYCSVLFEANHARRFTDHIKQPAVAVCHFSLYCTGLLGIVSTLPSTISSFMTRRAPESDMM